MTLTHVFLFAQDLERFNEGLRTFRIGLMLFALMLWGIGGFMVVEKPRPNQPVIAQRILGVILCAGGIALAAYAWFEFLEFE